MDKDVKTHFDPLSDLVVAQFAKPASLRDVNLRTLSPFQRVLLSIDGTVTKFIEAYTMEPVEIVRLAQEVQILSYDHDWLEATGGTPVMNRQVLLRGQHSYTVYAYAISLILPDRLPVEIKRGLALDGGGIGRILYSSRVETFRDVLWYGKERLRDLPSSLQYLEGVDAISRAYRIFAGGRPIMLISEKFPCNGDSLPSHQ